MQVNLKYLLKIKPDNGISKSEEFHQSDSLGIFILLCQAILTFLVIAGQEHDMAAISMISSYNWHPRLLAIWQVIKDSHQRFPPPEGGQHTKNIFHFVREKNPKMFSQPIKCNS